MKKLVFAMFALCLMAVGCSDKSSEKSMLKPVPVDSGVTVSCNFRYINVDTIYLYYTLAQELFAAEQREMNNLDAVGRQKQADLQNFAQQIDNKLRQNIYMSEQSRNDDLQKLQQRQAEAEQWLGSAQERVARMQYENRARLNDSLHRFLNEYNEVYGYDAIFDQTSGIFRPELDITAEIVAGLNERYAATQK